MAGNYLSHQESFTLVLICIYNSVCHIYQVEDMQEHHFVTLPEEKTNKQKNSWPFRLFSDDFNYIM